MGERLSINPATTEETVVIIGTPAHGRDWAWHGDANVLVLACHLTKEGRDRAVSEALNYWRRNCLRVVDNST